MTILITAILIVSLLFIATERQTHINKAAVAVFACTLGWVLYISFGADFVESRHMEGYQSFLAGIQPNSVVVKQYIANQREHHRHIPFAEEVERMFRKAGIEYDPQYMMYGLVSPAEGVS